MAFSKARLYNRRARITALYFRILNHPARQEILLKLAKDGPCSVEELLQDHPISGATMARHLEKLRVVNFISYKEKTPHIIYSIEPKKIMRAKKFMVEFYNILEKLMEKK
ncbi:MAG TPA: helix-turn-helix domain-containing protein [Saprospiraceae bacterium]|nr:helix-turn-helix domain-containing protein [Saprospiraceae bacterium]